MAADEGAEPRPAWEWPDDREEWREALRETPWWRWPRLWAMRLYFQGVFAFVWIAFRFVARAEAARVPTAEVADVRTATAIERLARVRRRKRRQKKRRGGR